MQCTVLLFAQLAEAVGTRELRIDLPDGCTVDAALEVVGQAHPVVAGIRGRLATAVNESYANLETVLPPGCTLALIPPVSGG